jgi:transposase
LYQQAGKSIVYIDESGFGHDMPRTHGYAIRGQRCIGQHDWGAHGRTNVIGALLSQALLTVSLFQGNIDTATFTGWLEQDLLPKLPASSVIVMDNATFHKNQTMQKSISLAGHSLEYLPPYSPDLNPIEKKWAQAKAVRRRVGCSITELFTQYSL